MEKTSKLTTKKLIAILAAIFVVCGLALGALVLTKDKVKEVAAEKEYTYVNPDETKAEADAGFTIDGVFDEAEYKKNTWLYLENTEGGANVDIAMTSYFGEKGMYFAYDVDEKNPVYVNLDRAAYLNSCVEMYLAPSYLSSLKGNSAFEIDMLPTGDLTFKKSNGKGGWVNVATTYDVMAYLGATTKGGAVNTPECKGYTLELFIPWTYMEQLGIDVDSMKNGYVYVNPAHITSFNETGTDTNIDRYHYWFAQQIGAGWNNVDAFFRFDTNGVQGSLPTVMEKGDSYTIEGAPDVIPGMKNTYTITPKEGQTFTSILVNGEEYIKDVSFTEEGVAILPIRGKLAGLKIEAKTEAVTEGNKTLNVTVASNKKGGDSLADVTITCKGPDGFEDVTLDAQGKFTIKNARQGFYTISAEKEGYKKVVRTVYLNRDMETNVTLDYDRFEVVSGTAWILDDQNKDLLYKFGGNNAVILSKDAYSDFAVESTLHYDTELAKLSDKDNFVQQRQGYRFAFTNDKTWHVDILKEKDKFILQYAKFSGDKSMTNWQNVYTLTKDDIAKLQSKDGIKFEVQRSGRVVNFLLGGKVVANEYLAKEYANLKAKVGFESWIANRAVQEIPFSITAKKISASGVFKVSQGWDLSKQNQGVITAVGGSANNGKFTNWLETFFDNYRDIAVVAKDVKNNGEYSLIYKFEFNNGTVFYARIQNSEKEQIVQVMGQGNSFTEKWERVCKLSTSQIEKLTTDGIEFRVAIIDETAHFYLDGIEVGTRDLSKTSDGKASKIKNETATISVRMDGNVGETVSMAYKLNQVALDIPKARYGSITTDKTSYAAGDTIVITAKNSDGTPCTEIIIDGKTVKLDANGSYSFKAQAKGHTVEGIFKIKEIFANTDTWDLSKEQEGILTVLGGNAGKGQSTVVTTKDDFYREVALKAKMEETEDLYSLIAFWKFTNGEKYVARLSHEIIKSGPRTIVQVLPIGNSFLEENNWSNTWVYTFTAAQEEKLKSEGVELRMALVDETMYFLLDGEQIGTRDLSKTIDGEPSNISEETAQIQIRLDGNTDKESKVEFELNKVAIVNPASKYGTVTTDKASYEAGETVTVTAQNRDGSPCTKLMVDGKKVSLDADGQYSFTVKAEGHALEGLFKEKDYFLSNDQWNLEDQGKGTVSVVGQENNTSNLVTKGNTYRGMTVNVRDNDADTKGFSAQMTFSFNNGEKLAVRLHNTDNDVNAYRVQLMNNTFVTAWTIVGSKLDNALVEKIRSEAGVDFTILIVEEEMRAYIDGKLWSSISLAKNLAGEDSNIMNETATVAFRIDKNTGYNNVVDFELYESAVNVIGDNRGTVQTNELGYQIDDKVTLTVKPETGYYCKSIKVDGKDVELSTDGTYGFEATKANYKVEAAFKKGLFKTNNEWNVINQHFGKLVVPATTDGNTNWLETTRSYTEIKAVAKYYAHTDYKNAPYGFVESFKFANNATVDIRITNSDNGTWRLKSMGGIYSWSDIYIFTDSEVKKLQGDGIEYKMVRKGTSLELWIDGRNVKTLDLTKNYKNEATGITADMDATARFCLFENKGYETEIPFELAGGPEKVTIDIKDTENGKITLAEDEYYMGDQVILKAEASKGYAYKSLKVDGKEVTLGWDGTYEFEVTKTEHEIEATFAKEIFVPNANWNLTNQNMGLVKASTTNSWLVTKDTYSVVTMKWQNQGAVNTGNRANYASYVRYYFTDATFIDIQILEWNGEYYLKSASASSMYGENVEYWSTLEVSDIGQKIEGEGVELKIVQDGTKIMFYIDGVRLEMKGSFQEGASYIDLTKDANLNDNNKGIESNSKATIRFYNDYAANGERVHEFSVSNDVPTGVTFDVTKKENGTVVCNPNACLLGDEATIEVTPADKYYCSGLKVDGKDVIDDTTVNIDGTYIYKFKTTKNSYTVEPIYSEKKVTLDIETEGNGTVTYTDAYVGEQIKITVTGKQGYNYEKVLVDGKDITNQIGWDGTYTFTTSKLIHKVEAGFKKGPWATTSSDWNLSKQNLNVLKTTYTGGSSTWLDAAGDYSEVAITVKDYSKGKGNFQAYVLFQFTVDGTLHTAGLRTYYEDGAYKIGGTGDSHVFKWAYLRKITEQSIIDKIQGDGVKFKLVREGTMIRVYLDGVYQSTYETRWDLTKYYGTTNATGITADTPTTRVTVVQCGNGGYNVEIPYTLTKVATITNNADQTNGTVALDKTSCNVGEKVTMTVTPKSGYYQDLKVNGEDVILDWDSMTYTFTAKETNTITGNFKSPEITEHNGGTEWDLRNQHKNLMAIQNFDASSNWMTMATGATDVDITLNTRNYTAGSAVKYVVRFYFPSVDKHATFRLTKEDRWGIQSMNDWKWIYEPMKQSELTALESADGLDFRVKKIGTMVHFYLAGQLVGQKDLSDYNMGITESSPLTVYVMMEGNVGKDVVVPFSINDRLAELQSKLAGKNISFIGDSISTFKGYSNDAGRNNTTGWNAVYYPATNVTNVNDTWWMRTANKAGLNLLVNNAWSGDKLVSRGLYRSTQLHNNAGTNPDIIAVYFGINDFDTGISVENFRKYYKRMVANIATKYPDADIFLMNYVPNKCNDRPVADMLAYNQIVADIAEQYGGTVVDLYNYSGITQSTCTKYMHDSIALHPNKLGMAAMSEVLLDAMYNKYVK